MVDMKEKLRRIERITTEEEPVTQKQAILLLLGVFAGMYDEISPHIQQVPRNTADIEVLSTRVSMGIGLTVVASIAVIVAALLL